MRAVVIVDGLNLYHALKDLGPNLSRPDLTRLSSHLLGRRFDEVEHFYFTSAPQHLGRAALDHYFLLKASLESSGVKVVEGRFQRSITKCKMCGNQTDVYKEKQTDVAMALKIVESAKLANIQELLLFSADADLEPALVLARELNPQLTLSIAQTGSFLKRAAYSLVSRADRKIKLSSGLMQGFQFPY